MKNTIARLLGASLSALLLFSFGKTEAQSLPYQMTYSVDDHRLTTGGVPLSGFYDEAVVNKIELFFDQPNYWTLLQNNYQSGTDLAATAIINGDTLASEIGVRFKGTTSYFQNQNSDKKSFNLTLDYIDSDQNYEGYETMNLHNCFQDPSFMREVMFYHISRRHIPIANANYTELYINGENWGLYPNVQQLNGEFFDEWFLGNDGTSWRALDPDFSLGGPGGPPGGNPFGTGFSTLNWLGADTTEYQDYYTLKRTKKDNPWDDLVATCDVLNNTPLADLEAAANEVMDVDRALWFLAHEIIFADDDSYAYKGGMDYYLYWEEETGRMVPQEYDANSCMRLDMADWSPFYNENDDDFVLMNRFFAVPELRQRYLAHVRTIIGESLEQGSFDAQVETYFDLIAELVENDPEKIYSYNQFLNQKEELKTFAAQRRGFLLGNAEVGAEGPDILGVAFSANGSPFSMPDAGQPVTVTASVSNAVGVANMYLYHGSGFVGKFAKQEMYDDGAHGDGAAGDGVFGAELPGQGNGTYVRFYVEAVADDAAKTVAYEPAGAEHDVYIYRVNVNGFVDSDVVVNEFMAKNTTVVADQDGEFDDWIELFNTAAATVDLSGWYLSDDPSNLEKWQFPTGTTIDGGGYLIIWADEDGSQEGLHTNFKLSGSGEELYLLTPEKEVAQEIVFGEQQDDLAYARIPNGTGDFVIQPATFAFNNEDASSAGETDSPTIQFSVFPNPATQHFTVLAEVAAPVELSVFNLLGQPVVRSVFLQNTTVDVSGWAPGLYLVQVGGAVKKVMVE